MTCTTRLYSTCTYFVIHNIYFSYLHVVVLEQYVVEYTDMKHVHVYIVYAVCIHVLKLKYMSCACVPIGVGLQFIRRKYTL